MNNTRVGVVGFSGQKFDVDAANTALREMFDEIAETNTSITVVSGLTDLGIPALAYREADKRGWRTAGIACAKATEYDLYPCDETVLVGAEWGDESPTFLANIDVLVRVGGGKQSFAEAAEFRSLGGRVLEQDLEATP